MASGMATSREMSASEHQALSATETAHMLKLCAAQIADALRECDTAIENLLESFGGIADDAQWFWRSANGAAKGRRLDDEEPTDNVEITARSARLVARANAAIQALQFHDRLTQRLGHVRHSLEKLGEFVTDQNRSSRADHWVELHATLGRLYRTREEVAIFEAMSKVEKHIATRETPPARAGSEIELF